jgi:signal transduction histidine kinase
VDTAVEVDPEADLVCEVDPGQIEQVVTNLLMNAIQAMDRGGSLTVRIGRGPCPLEDVEHVHVAVADDGPGIAPEDMPRVFDPFFTTKDPGEGTGLGLSVVHGILEEHGGAVTVASTPGEGATFTVHLPVEGP